VDVITIVVFLAGLSGLLLGARLLVQGAARLALTLGISPIVIGLTVVAFGTGSPELAVTAGAAITGNPGLALGNVVGSNIANILMVVGFTSVIMPLTVRVRLVRWDVPVMIAVSFLLLALGWDGNLDRLDGLIFFCGIVAYLVISIVTGRSRVPDEVARKELEQEVKAEPVRGARALAGQIALILVGLALLVVGARALVQSSISIAEALGVSDLIIGLTVVAIGTSLPEAATSVVAAMKGEREMALGNAVGSNIFNILAVLGVAGLVSPDGVPVSNGALRFDIPVMIAVAIACLPVVFTGARISRGEGALFLGYYIAYLVYLFLVSTKHDQRELFDVVMLVFVIPLTVIGLGLTVIHAVRTGRTTVSVQESESTGAAQD